MMGAFGGAVQLTGRSGILESGVWTESRSTFEETMAIYIHDAPFSLPPFPSDQCDRCLINGPDQSGTTPGRITALVERRTGAQQVGDVGRDAKLTPGLVIWGQVGGQALQPGSNGVKIHSAPNRILGGSTCICSNSYLNIANSTSPCDSRERRQDGNTDDFQPPLIFST